MNIPPVAAAFLGLLLINVPLIAFGVYAKRRSDQLAAEIERHEMEISAKVD